MMKFYQLAIKNVVRNQNVYLAYFLSSLFTVMIFFTFANFAFHPAIASGALGRNVTVGMLVAGGIIYAFSFFFILYSMGSFLQSRKKEFGVFMIQGMAPRQLRWLVFIENMLLGLLAIIFGISLGTVFSKAILLIAENVLIMEDQLPFYFPTRAITLTFGSFIILFFIISLFMTNVLRTNKLVTLIKGEQVAKSEPKASVILTILAVILLGIGYAIALTVKAQAVIMALVPVVIIVVIGTYFLFTQLSVFLIHRLKNRKLLFWRGTNMLLFSDLTYRMKDNARAFFLVAIISTVTFSAIGSLVGFSSLITDSFRTAQPISFEYLHPDEEDEVSIIEQTLADHDLTVEKAEIELTFFEQDGRQTLITTPDHYNAYAKLIGEKEIRLMDQDMLAVKPSERNVMQDKIDLHNIGIDLADGEQVFANEELSGLAKQDVLPEIRYYFIMSDELYAKLPDPDATEKRVAWQVVEGSSDNIIDAGQVLTEQFAGFMAVDWAIYDIKKGWSVVLFVGLFIGIVFFVAAGSFLYFRLYRDLEDDKYKFTAIRKIGLTTKEMKRVISRQIGLLFFAPIIVAIIHGAVALTALSHMFGESLFIESTLVLASFFVIQVIYFLVVKYFYTKQIEHVIH